VETMTGRLREWLYPLVLLSANPISLVGVVLTTTGAILWLFLLPTMLSGSTSHPYLGIATFLILPIVFFLGLALIPLGIWLRKRRERKLGLTPATAVVLDLKNPQFRRLAAFFLATTAANVVIGAQYTYRAVTYMESVSFCGQTCHTVMQPEFTAYQNSPHSRVDCVACHIGAGANWFVKSKLSGSWQVVSVTFNLYPRPIPTPVENLRPARETCEQCHWPQKYGADRIRVIDHYAEDEQNTNTKTVLLMRIGGGKQTRGIHGVHLGPGVVIRYGHTDRQRQDIPWVEYRDGKGQVTEYWAGGKPLGNDKKMEIRTMDCMDCHNRPSHAFEMPERALDHALSAGEAPTDLPFLKKEALALLKRDYPSHEAATQAIREGLERFYREKYPDLFAKRKGDVERAAQAVAAIHNRNVFPSMRVRWGIYPNNIGHTDFPGCFRCHDDNHTAGERKISQDCNSCHQMLAMEESNPKVLADLGLTP
jgi:hypothetical protein